MVRVVTYLGYELEALQKLSMDEFIKLLPSRLRRSLRRGFTEEQRKLINRIRKAKQLGDKATKTSIRTHVRDMIVLPEMVGFTIDIYDGKTYQPTKITIDHVGHYFGEFSITNKKVTHGNPGIGATKSSQFVPLK